MGVWFLVTLGSCDFGPWDFGTMGLWDHWTFGPLDWWVFGPRDFGIIQYLRGQTPPKGILDKANIDHVSLELLGVMGNRYEKTLGIGPGSLGKWDFWTIGLELRGSTQGN